MDKETQMVVAKLLEDLAKKIRDGELVVDSAEQGRGHKRLYERDGTSEFFTTGKYSLKLVYTDPEEEVREAKREAKYMVEHPLADR